MGRHPLINFQAKFSQQFNKKIGLENALTHVALKYLNCLAQEKRQNEIEQKALHLLYDGQKVCEAVTKYR